jgi:integrase/recombinase XerD
MSIKLREKENSDKKTKTLYLDIYHDGLRKREFLTHLRFDKNDRNTRKAFLAQAQTILAARALELSASDYNLTSDTGKKVDVIKWMESYAKKYAKADIRVIEGVTKRFKTFLEGNRLTGLQMKGFNESIVIQFKNSLVNDCEGEGARSYYARFRKMVREAVRVNHLTKNPCEFVKPPRGKAREKDVLTNKELQLFAETETEAKEVKKAFLFCSQTGLRYVDIKSLTWNSVNLEEKTLKFKQSKTDIEITTPLNRAAIALMGPEGGDKERVFNLPSANGCNKSIQAIVDRAKIKKKITWHSARHSFGTNLILSGTDIYTVSNVLGHTTLKHTQIYVRKSKEMNQKAVDSLPQLDI